MDEDGLETALQRLNIIIKVRRAFTHVYLLLLHDHPNTAVHHFLNPWMMTALQRLNLTLNTMQSGAAQRHTTPTPTPPLPQADASGSCEAVKSALGVLPQDSVMLRYLLAAPGEIGMTDLDLAVASQAMVLGFNVQPSEAVQVRSARPAPARSALAGCQATGLDAAGLQPASAVTPS